MSDEDVDVDTTIAMAVGLVVLDAATIPEAADVAGTTRWQVEDAIKDAGLAEHCGLDEDGDVAADIDALLDEHS
ncbi:hypothetical protein ACKVMT_01205 [Halobacteriales archaeon Cl-PHB]